MLEHNRDRLGWVVDLVNHRPQVWCSSLKSPQNIAFIHDSFMVSDALDDDWFLTSMVSVGPVSLLALHRRHG